MIFMKKTLFGYKISEVDKIIESLRNENENLNAEIARLKIEKKNEVDSAKTVLLEENLKNYEKELIRLKSENSEIKSQNEQLAEENINLKRQIAELKAMLDEAAAAKE